MVLDKIVLTPANYKQLENWIERNEELIDNFWGLKVPFLKGAILFPDKRVLVFVRKKAEVDLFLSEKGGELKPVALEDLDFYRRWYLAVITLVGYETQSNKTTYVKRMEYIPGDGYEPYNDIRLHLSRQFIRSKEPFIALISPFSKKKFKRYPRLRPNESDMED